MGSAPRSDSASPRCASRRVFWLDVSLGETSQDDVVDALRIPERAARALGGSALTLHQERVALPAALMPDLPEERGKAYAGYSVLQAMVASTFDALEEVELRLDDLAAASTGGGGGRLPRATVRAAAARLAAVRRWVTAEQAVFGRIATGIDALRGFDADDEPYFDRLNERSARDSSGRARGRARARPRVREYG